MAEALANQNPNTVAIIASNFARGAAGAAKSGFRRAVELFRAAGPPSPLQFTNFRRQSVLENMGRAIRQYGAMFGGNPVGTNPGNHRRAGRQQSEAHQFPQRRGRHARQ